MKQQKINYVLRRDPEFRNQVIAAKRELSYGIQLASRLLLDEMCFRFNKQRLDAQINDTLENEDRETFERLSKIYDPFTRE
ncbi:IDEAL domain-containing protein [Thalassobacillus sp. CUG 92003]|uniref:IDEAL domain-containing protein n=1 Tax=Thalassobacillus sp. CUG 92003 TaxID=2736641 RepID=UPI0015E7835A|nr:IDEAL domain-containing protein [Thalassobacillus sp. CUG 92003]